MRFGFEGFGFKLYVRENGIMNEGNTSGCSRNGLRGGGTVRVLLWLVLRLIVTYFKCNSRQGQPGTDITRKRRLTGRGHLYFLWSLCHQRGLVRHSHGTLMHPGVSKALPEEPAAQRTRIMFAEGTRKQGKSYFILSVGGYTLITPA